MGSDEGEKFQEHQLCPYYTTYILKFNSYKNSVIYCYSNFIDKEDEACKL